MNTFKAEVNKIILALTSVGIVILLMFPVSLSADHFRYGTMSWETISDNGTHKTVRLKMQNGWTADHWAFNNTDANGNNLVNPGDTKLYAKGNSVPLLIRNFGWGDDDNSSIVVKVLSRDNATAINNIITEIGDNSSGWTTGVTHSYSGNGPYIISWNHTSRETTENMGASEPWLNKTLVNLGEAYDNNTSPVSAVPPVIQVQDNTIFTYQVTSSDTTGDNLAYRWGTYAEFFASSGTYTKPTGMTLSSSGLITWDVRDSVLCSGCSQNDVNDADDLWVSVIMIEDRHDNGSVKSYIPIDFFFKITATSNDPASLSGIPQETQIVSVGNTKNITFTSNDDSGVAPTITVLNPPSDNSSIWSTTSSNSMVGEDNTTTFTIKFKPDSSMGGNTYVVNIRSTDNAGMTRDQSFSIQISSVANADPTAPILLSPANGDNVTSPVTFQFAASTDSDNDKVSYTMYICDNSGFVGCSGTSVTAGGNFVPPFNQNFHDNLIPWPSPLYAATSSQQISQDHSMIPKWFIMLGMLGLLSVIISLSVKNITHRRIVYVLFLIIIGTAVSCSKSSDDTVDDSTSGDSTSGDSTSDNSTSDNSTSDNTTTSSDTTAPTASVTTAAITNSSNAVVQSTETGTAYLVKTTVSVSNLASITGAADSQWNSAAISSANTNTNLAATGLVDGTYKVYAVDAAGNLSNASRNSVTLDTTAPAITGTTVASNNESIAVTFSKAVYNTSGGSGALEASDFTLTLSGGTATLASATPSSISSSSNTYTLGLSLSGTPNGSETITVVPSSSTAIYETGRAAG